METSKRNQLRLWLIIGGGIIIAAAVAAVLIWLLAPKHGPYSPYTYVVVAEDTPQEVLEELSGYHVSPVEYVAGSTLYGGNAKAYFEDFTPKTKIYLCEGTYETGTSAFIRLRGAAPHKQVEIAGAGKDKVKVIGGKNKTENLYAGILVEGAAGNPVTGVTIKDISIKGYEYGVRLVNADHISLLNCEIISNSFVGLSLENANSCNISGNDIISNGKAETDDLGYGLTLLHGSRDNNGDDNFYKNNGNRNAVDFSDRGVADTDALNPITLKKEFNVVNRAVPIRLSRNKPGDTTLSAEAVVYELEDARMEGDCVPTRNSEVIQSWSGEGYAFIGAEGKMELDVEVEQEGYYNIYVTSTTTDGNNKCEKLQVNGGQAWLVATDSKTDGTWTRAQPGTEVWVDNKLTPKPPVDGFLLQAGKNTITITAHWGNCCYDTLIIEPQ